MKKHIICLKIIFIICVYSLIFIIPPIACSTLEGMKKDINAAAKKVEQVTSDDNTPLPTKTSNIPITSAPQKKLVETVIIPDTLIYRSDGKYFDYKTKEAINSDVAIKMTYDYEKRLNDTPPLSPFSTSPVPTKLPVTSQYTPQSTPTQTIISLKYISLFNDFRGSNGLQSLQFTSQLNNVALLRVKEIAIRFSHDGIDKYGSFGENIAMSTGGYLSDENTLRLWQNSPGHRQNMLDSRYTKTGYSNVGGYAVQIFSW